MMRNFCRRVSAALAAALAVMAAAICMFAAAIPLTRTFGHREPVDSAVAHLIYHTLAVPDLDLTELMPNYRIVTALAAVVGVIIFTCAFLLLTPTRQIRLPSVRPLPPAKSIGKLSHVVLISSMLGIIGSALVAPLSTRWPTPSPDLWLWLTGIAVIILYAVLLDGFTKTFRTAKRSAPPAAYVVGLLLVLVAFTFSLVLEWRAALLAALIGIVLMWPVFRHANAQRFEYFALALIVAGGFLLCTTDLTAWYYSVIGDEYDFLAVARQFLTPNPPAFLANGAYQYHPAATSCFQAWSMSLFGQNAFGWKVLGSFQLAVAVLALYAFLRPIFGVPLSLAGAMLLATTGYAHAIARTGYNNVEALTMCCLALAAINSATTGNRLQMVLLGCVAGYCFHTFAAARLIPIFILWWFVIWVPPTTAERRSAWLLAAAAGIMVAWPQLINVSLWTEMFRHGPVKHAGDDPLDLQHMTMQAVQSIWLGIDGQARSHHYLGPHLSLIPNTLLLMGLGALVARAATRRTTAFILFLYLLFVVLLGSMHPYDYPPNTRMHLALPAYILLAATGLRAACMLLATVLARSRQAISWGAVAVLSPTLFISEAYLTFAARRPLVDTWHEEVQLFAGVALQDQFGSNATLILPCERTSLTGEAAIANSALLPQIAFTFADGADHRLAVLRAHRSTPAILAVHPDFGIDDHLAVAREAWDHQGMELRVYWAGDGMFLSHWVVSPAVQVLTIEVPPQLRFEQVR